MLTQGWSAAWSHSDEIAFVIPGDIQGDIWKVPASGGTAALVAAGLGRQTVPVWSPDGKRISFLEMGGDSAIWIADIGGMLK